MTRLLLENIGPVHKADLRFGDLTVLVGPQATGKSLALQWLKLLLDTGCVQQEFLDHGIDPKQERPGFLDLYFGEGMRSQWRERKSKVLFKGKPVQLDALIGRIQVRKSPSAFFVPAQRVLTLREGWPRLFREYSLVDPYVVRAFSEQLRTLMEQELAGTDSIFAGDLRLKAEYRRELDHNIFSGFRLVVDRSRPQRRLILKKRGANAASLPFMVWSAGQREFVPLYLGLLWLLPGGFRPRRQELSWVILEELEMGLHPKAISIVMLLVLELLHRGYHVCLSTHSAQVLETVWALRALAHKQAKPGELLQIFGQKATPNLTKVAKTALEKTARVYYFDQGTAHDITNLNPASKDEREALWGGLLEFTGRTNEAVARVMSTR